VRFEPPAALASGADGLDAIRTIIRGAAVHLKSGSWLLFEHGYNQLRRAANCWSKRASNRLPRPPIWPASSA